MTLDLHGGTDVETEALILVGDADSFARLAQRLRDAEATTVQLQPVTGRSAIRAITCLRLQPVDDAASIDIAQGTATLSGDRASFARLAAEIEAFIEHNDLDEPGMHAHLDPASWPGRQRLLGPASRGLILAGPVPDSL